MPVDFDFVAFDLADFEATLADLLVEGWVVLPACACGSCSLPAVVVLAEAGLNCAVLAGV